MARSSRLLVIGEQIQVPALPRYAMYGFAVFYALCLGHQLVVLPPTECLREESLTPSDELQRLSRPAPDHHQHLPEIDIHEQLTRPPAVLYEGQGIVFGRTRRHYQVKSRVWEDSYRKRWQHDKIVRSTHGVNCTGSCSWKIYVKRRSS
jgi:hypothetical protein